MSKKFSVSEDQLRTTFADGVLSFETTDELKPIDDVIGQDRAIEAIHFGAEIDRPGYNIFALGPRGTGKSKTIEEYLQQQAKEGEIPSDWIYVNDFDDPDAPNAIELPCGVGRDLRDDMDEFVQQLKTEVPEAFDSDEYRQEREQIQSDYETRQKELLEELEQTAREQDFTVLQTPGGHMLAPVVDGEVMTPDEFANLDEEKREEIEERRDELQGQHKEITNRIQELQQKARQEVNELDRRIVQQVVSNLVDQLKETYKDLDEVVAYLDEVTQDLMDNVKQFKQLGQSDQNQAPRQFAFLQQREGPNFDKYRVNLLVDHGESCQAPVVVESNPTYYNLVGRIEHEGQMGELHTDFTMIKSGALHRANGGYLILEAKEVLSKPFAWEGLKRALKNEEIKTEAMGQEYRAIQTKSLEPETIPLDVNVVLLGSSEIYYLLCQYDEDFSELFKVKADFNTQTGFNSDVAQQFARYVAGVCEEEELRPFTAAAVEKILEEHIREVSHQEKISTQIKHLEDLVRQSDFWAGKNGNGKVEADDVKMAIDKQIYRANRIEERMQELIEEKTILIDTDGSKVGQVNGLSVLPLGDYQFGKPSRITARTHPGEEGVINIEREADLGGRIHNKGVMILSGYLQGEFSADYPLALSASLTFEQSYSEVDGDSASSAELYALLSSLSELPLRQDLAVTGSINQHGEVQAIGGVNDKIKGFYQVCKNAGLTGEQGVMIPSSNVKHLMLRDEVVNAVREGQFHVYAVDHVDQGIELLTGTPAGELQDDGTYPEGTVKHAVAGRLKELSEAVREFSGAIEQDEEE